MDLDDVTLELRTREQVRVALSEFPLLESDQDRVKAVRRLIRHAGKEIGAKVRTVHVRHLGDPTNALVAGTIGGMCALQAAPERARSAHLERNRGACFPTLHRDDT
jgi:hypothetical protein